LVAQAKACIPEVSVADVLAMRSRGDALTVIDTREKYEWDAGHIDGALHLSKGTIERDIELAIGDMSAVLVLYCGGGYRSALATEALRRMGYTNAVSLDGGWRAWQHDQNAT
jgi:rhodanese-related sulfurtransferase